MLEIESLGGERAEYTFSALESEQSGADAAVSSERRKRDAEMLYGSDDEMDAELADAWQDFRDELDYWTITKMTPGVRDPNRVNIFLDGNFAFSLDVTQVVDFGLKVQQKLARERLVELQKASEFGKFYQRTLEWVVTRPHSIRETRDYLKRRQIKRRQLNRQRARDEKRPLPVFEDDVMALVTERLIEKGYLDDRRFAEYYVENRYVRKGISQKRLKMELQKKGVESNLITAALEKIPRDERDEMAKMIAKKRRKYNDFQLVNYLVRQGFNFQQAKEAVEKWTDKAEE